MKKLPLLFISFLLLFVTFGQIPPHYYTDAEGKKEQALRTALSEIITNGYVQRTYSALWTDFRTTDVRADGKVWDMYSNCTFTFGVDQDQGSGGQAECDKYNREHSLPISWFGGSIYPMYSDLFHIYPTDKFVNAERANFPYGETTNPTRIYGNGSKKGPGTAASGYTGVIFEPIDEYKGDFARTYFYMATRYLNVNFTQKDQGDVTFVYENATCDLTDYAINLLLKWHRNDPVSEKETNRNNVVYTLQNNRNPYIDYPELAEHIWGTLRNVAWKPGVSITQNKNEAVKIIKCSNGIRIENAAPNVRIEVYAITGQKLYTASATCGFIALNHLSSGFYIVKIGEYTTKIVW